MRFAASAGSTGDWIARGLLLGAAAAAYASIIVGHYRKRAQRRRQGLPPEDPSEGSIWEIFVPLGWIVFASAMLVLGAIVGHSVGGRIGGFVGGFAGGVAALLVGIWLLQRKESPGGGAREFFAAFLFLLSVPAGASVGAYVKSATDVGPGLLWLAATGALLVIFVLGLVVLLGQDVLHLLPQRLGGRRIAPFGADTFRFVLRTPTGDEVAGGTITLPVFDVKPGERLSVAAGPELLVLDVAYFPMTKASDVRGLLEVEELPPAE